MFSATKRRHSLAITAGLATTALLVAACGSGGGGGGGKALLVGTTDKVTTLDPAGSYDNGSLQVQIQVFPYLVGTDYQKTDVVPDLAESAEFTSPTDYTVKLPSGLKWANGHALTSSDVKFTFDRQLKIADENGPSSLLYNLDSVETPDDTTVVFHLKSENDQTFPLVLTSFPGAIVDEEVFSPDAVTPDDDIVKGNAFAGPYTITSYKFNQLIQFKKNPSYQGLLPEATTDEVNLQYYDEASNLKLAIQQGDVDVAFRSLSATDIADLRTNKDVKVVDGPGGEIRYIVFNFDTQPYGAKTADADPDKALAVRQAVADLVDRAAISDQVYKGTYTPLYSFIPQGFAGAIEPLKDLYGDGSGGPDVDKAKQTLADAGVTTPVELDLQYNPDHYGPSSGDEYAAIKDQLDGSGLFTVNLQSTEWVQYSKDRTSDVYPAYQLGWFPDYSDADNYLTPFFLWDEDAQNSGFLANHFPSEGAISDAIKAQAVTTDPDERVKKIEDIQTTLAGQLPTVPLLQGAQVAVTRTNVSGADTTLDASFKFRFAALSKG
jgi:peptide/nickel transport system substrate-binding protein